ncbi:carbohydrate kinase family protein [Neptunomonas antarctica]|uniref:Fructokinase n=1 Tax=Neptunomonas antarctica TaxID=619304 RepID=A0A1N7L216_9GAMM|nr:carbohydrate kinase [Neptunomonas antarctica]SIS67867.1 fructokinase [Neptunomonas antarctica]
MQKVISFGEALVDMLSSKVSKPAGKTEAASHESFTKFPGGAPANVAAAVGKLGGNSVFVGQVGADMFGDFMKASLEDAGVDTRYLLQSDEGKTALAFVSLDDHGERSFEFYRNASADLLFSADDFQESCFEGGGLFHFCSNTLTEPAIRAATLAGIDKAKSAGCIISFDVNLRLNLWPEGADPFEFIWACLERADIVKLCVEELNFICRGQVQAQVIERLLSLGIALVLVTDGGKPLRYHTQERTGTIQPPSVAMVDSTAAGDAFIGGLLYALAEQNISAPLLSDFVAIESALLKSALTFASACGAYAVAHQGAFSSLPGKEDLTPAYFA